ncbi:uroporphyrinogen-III synthase [Halalkalibacter wakoensis JCM 9140]|uniref:Uroporphyrinogen-III synthase n=1 Tax=Halalkalibacter wakoensis JCM 9140 TaxID=1236970 RepID=W4Q377_9BACI|nr:uroporphyrinogen-III synthase [Halalkalibacter wakoensis]GAE26412.1 uroporphyrinogen-III synthase [Halalkalibacter wakoensis JCM 9140]
MKTGLSGKKIVLAASRKTDEMSKLVEKQNGTPLVRSLQGTVFKADEQVKADIKKIVNEQFDWMIFTTGIGTNALVDLAEELDLLQPFLQVIQKAKVGSRGYKTFAALKKLDVAPDVKDDDGTIKGLLAAFEGVDFAGKKVLVQLHGENAPALIQYLEQNGADVMQVLPYQHVDPDFDVVEKLCQELIHSEVDAVCFTAAIQVRSFFNYVKKKGYVEQVLEAFKEDVLAVAVGKVTAEALTEEGVERIVAPELERMGAMIVEMTRYYELNK